MSGYPTSMSIPQVDGIVSGPLKNGASQVGPNLMDLD